MVIESRKGGETARAAMQNLIKGLHWQNEGDVFWVPTESGLMKVVIQTETENNVPHREWPKESAQSPQPAEPTLAAA